MTAQQRFSETDLRQFATAVLCGLGASEETAGVVVDALVEADRRGVATHGLIRLPSYCLQVESGEIDPQARPRIEKEGGGTAVIDGALAFGAVTATFGMDEAIARARRYGVSAVGARRCTHFGAAAHYALRAAASGYVGITATNTPGVMAPTGGAEPVLGNNPFAVAAPAAGGRPPFVLDMAQTSVSRGRIKLAELANEPIPEGWALDPQGRSTTDPTSALAGALLPFGGYKGYGLALAVEILTGVLTGAGLSPDLLNTSMTGMPARAPGVVAGSVGNLYIAIDPDRFVGRDTFRRRITHLLDAVKRVRRAAGVSEVMVPGELEAREVQAAKHGIPLRDVSVTLLRALAAERAVAFPAPLA